MSGQSTYVPKSALAKWFEARLPIGGLVHSSFIAYPTPRNLNYMWTFGGILSFMLVAQIVTGIVLAMHYTPEATLAFNSVEHIMRDVNSGWLLRYLHMNGASMFFIAAYVHTFRGLYYGSYKAPREILWLLGVIILLLMMATAFTGYVLPWGQMSFWGATVITNLFSAIPIVGETIVTYLWGGYAVGGPTLNRFYSLHYLLPFVIAGVVVLHVWALHVVGQNNPAGIDVKSSKDTLPFTPYATVKDAFGLTVFLLVYCWFVFYAPNILGDADNYIPANALQTPAKIVPEWYFLPFYAILRSMPDIFFIPAKLAGVIAMFGAIALLALVPWLDTSKVRSASFRPIYRQFIWVLLICCLGLGYIGSKEVTPNYILVGRILTAYYYVHFLIILPLLGLIETPKPLPNSISDSVLGGATAMPVGAAAAPERKG
jgi:ubiquinol-cytochrome c reductase cytochrome b/c1 subunit